MIRVHKTATIPAVLLGAGATQTTADCGAYDAHSADYDAGTKKFSASASIYGHEVVKEQLIAEQYGKCCFCEADFTANGYGDVEHFRPKAGYQTTLSGKLNRPGYYWLAYNWQNLYFSCQICNQRHKKNFFPLDDETNRARNHTYDLTKERVQLIHPGEDNPADHLQFNRHVVAYKTPKGQKSIQGYGLARPKINAAREAHLQNVANNVALAGINLDTLPESEKQFFAQRMNLPWPLIEQLVRTAKAFVAVAASDQKPFALMVRQNFPQLPF